MDKQEKLQEMQQKYLKEKLDKQQEEIKKYKQQQEEIELLKNKIANMENDKVQNEPLENNKDSFKKATEYINKENFDKVTGKATEYINKENFDKVTNVLEEKTKNINAQTSAKLMIFALIWIFVIFILNVVFEIQIFIITIINFIAWTLLIVSFVLWVTAKLGIRKIVDNYTNDVNNMNDMNEEQLNNNNQQGNKKKMGGRKMGKKKKYKLYCDNCNKSVAPVAFKERKGIFRRILAIPIAWFSICFGLGLMVFIFTIPLGFKLCDISFSETRILFTGNKTTYDQCPDCKTLLR